MKSFFNSFSSSSNVVSSPSSTHDEDLRDAAKDVYRQSVLWHGTKHEHLRSLRESGFSKRLKKEGATTGGDMFMSFSDPAKSEARNQHYFASDRRMAKDFAMFADMNNPALVRTIGVKSNFNLETDPRTGEPAVCTTDSIPAKYVLGSKSSPAGANAKVFKKEMKRAGHDVSTDRAGQLLKEVQSDSDDDDFPDPDLFIRNRLTG
ncbi:hypothetical protein ACFX58_09855 [Sphingomonas sp. NCPPB 2930]